MSLWTRLTLLAMGVLLIIGGVQLTSWERARALEKELQATKTELEQLHIEHRDTLDAITSAMDTREKIYEQAKRREELLQEALDGNDISDLVLPDDILLRLCWGEDTDCEVAAP